MKKYIGVKIISAEPMIEGGFKTAGIHGGIVAREGYKVVYENGHTSWSPKDVFEDAYKSTDGLTFGLAVEAMKIGKKVARTGWNRSGMFAVLLPGMKQLKAEGFFNKDLNAYVLSIGGNVDVRPAFMLKTAQDDVAYWAPSGSDCLAEDWFVIE